VFEAAKVDGASPIQTFVHIILPLIRPHMIIATVLNGILLLKAIDLIYVMLRAGRDGLRDHQTSCCILRPFPSTTSAMLSAIAVVFSLIHPSMTTGILHEVPKGRFMSRTRSGRIRFRYYLWVPLILILCVEMFSALLDDDHGA